jgi:hypothetical protein
MVDYEALANDLQLVAIDLINEHYRNGPGVQSIIEDLLLIIDALEKLGEP